MKICQLCAVDFTLYHFLLPLMRGMAACGHEVVGVCGDGALVAKVRDAGFRVETLPIARSLSVPRHARSYRAMVRLFRRERFDIVHVHTPVAALLGRLAATRAGVPIIVYTAHGFYFHDRMPALKRALFIALEWIGGRFTHVLFTQAEEDAATARRLGLCRTGVVTAIGNGVDPALFASLGAPDRAGLRDALGVPWERVVVVAVGRLVAEKGYPELIEAMRHVDAELWIVGERLGSDHADAIDGALQAAQRDPVLRKKIRMLGYRSDIAAILNAGDIFALPSHREGMPRSIIEAMFAGLPVVATDIRGSREEVVDGETGILVPVGDRAALTRALQALAADTMLRGRYGEAGAKRAALLYDEAEIIRRQLTALDLRSAEAA